MADELIAKLRYMGRQYANGQMARGGGDRKHYLEEAADWIESAESALAKSASREAALVEKLKVVEESLDWLDRNALINSTERIKAKIKEALAKIKEAS